MDYVTRQFINLTKKFRRELRAYISNHTHALEQQTKAIREATKATSEKTQDALPVPLPVLAELQLPEAEKRERNRQYDKSHTVQIWLTAGTWFAFLAAAIYAGIAACQLRRTDEAIQQSAKQFMADQRPYVVVGDYALHSVIAYKPITQPTLGEGFSIEVHFRNVGKTPALKAMTHVHLVTDMQKIKSEPLEKDRSDSDIIAQGGWVFRGAVLIEDTYAGEDGTKPSLPIPYKTGPVFAFGRVTYYDSAGNLYCTPYMERLDSDGEWKSVRGVRNTSGELTLRLIDLCAGIPPY